MCNLKEKEIDWNYDVEGEAHNSVLVFFHGWGVDHRIWKQQTKYLSKEYRVLNVDLPGHGQSSWSNFSLKDMMQSFKEVLDREQIDKFSIIASSLGGLFALSLYDLCKDRVEKISFTGSLPRFCKNQKQPYGLDVDQLRKLEDQINTSYPSIVNVFFRSLFTIQERSTRRFKWLQRFRKFDQVPMQKALSSYLDVLEKEDLKDVLLGVNIPIQFINGLEDPICNRLAVDALKSMCPSADFYDFVECGHFPFLTQPYEFNEVLEKFLK